MSHLASRARRASDPTSMSKLARCLWLRARQPSTPRMGRSRMRVSRKRRSISRRPVARSVWSASLSSLYSSAGCDFIRLDIGFTPSNEAWNQSTAELGLFVYQSGESSMNKYHEAFVDGCQWYEDTFNEDFIEHDRTWKVARIMAYISFLSSALAMV